MSANKGKGAARGNTSDTSDTSDIENITNLVHGLARRNGMTTDDVLRRLSELPGSSRRRRVERRVSAANRVFGSRDLVTLIAGKLERNRDMAMFSGIATVPRVVAKQASPKPSHFFSDTSVRLKLVAASTPTRQALTAALTRVFGAKRARPGVPSKTIVRFPAPGYARLTRVDLENAMLRQLRHSVLPTSTDLVQSVLRVVMGLHGRGPDLEAELLRFVKLVHGRNINRYLVPATTRLSKTGMYVIAFLIGALPGVPRM